MGGLVSSYDFSVNRKDLIALTSMVPTRENLVLDPTTVNTSTTNYICYEDKNLGHHFTIWRSGLGALTQREIDFFFQIIILRRFGTRSVFNLVQ